MVKVASMSSDGVLFGQNILNDKAECYNRKQEKGAKVKY